MAESLKAFDSIDCAILKMLHQNCWISIAEIARTLKINERTAKKRRDRLVSTGACRPTVIVSPEVFGYTTIVDIELHVETQYYEETINNLSHNVVLSYMSSGWGEMNLLVQARFKNSEEMHIFINETLPGMPGIRILKYEIVPKIFFNTDTWQPSEQDFKMNE